MDCINFRAKCIFGVLLFSYSAVCQEVAIQGIQKHNSTAVISCSFDNKEPFVVSWYLPGNQEMTRDCAITGGGEILRHSDNCHHAPTGVANYTFIIDRLDISRDLDESWACRFGSTELPLNISFYEEGVEETNIYLEIEQTEYCQSNIISMGVNIDCAYPPQSVIWCLVVNDDDRSCSDEPGYWNTYFQAEPVINETFHSCEPSYGTDIVKSLESIFTGTFSNSEDTSLSFEILVNGITVPIKLNGEPVTVNFCSDSLSAGAIVGIVIAVLAVVILVPLGIYCFVFRENSNHTT